MLESRPPRFKKDLIGAYLYRWKLLRNRVLGQLPLVAAKGSARTVGEAARDYSPAKVLRALSPPQSGDLAGVDGILMVRVQTASDQAAAEILAALVQGLLRAYRLDGAMSCSNEPMKRRPNDPIGPLERGSLWVQPPDEKRAADDYRQAVETQPDFVDARCRLGDVLLNHGQPAETLLHCSCLPSRGLTSEPGS